MLTLVIYTVYDRPILHDKTPISGNNSLMTPFLLCSYFPAHPRQHYFLKYWGAVPLGLRPWTMQIYISALAKRGRAVHKVRHAIYGQFGPLSPVTFLVGLVQKPGQKPHVQILS